MRNDPIYMYLGVLQNVANDPGAIGFCNAQHRSPGIKRIAIAPQTELSAYGPTPADVYSRAGQECFARRNQAPLSATQVREIRDCLGLE